MGNLESKQKDVGRTLIELQNAGYRLNEQKTKRISCKKRRIEQKSTEKLFKKSNNNIEKRKEKTPLKRYLNYGHAQFKQLSPSEPIGP